MKNTIKVFIVSILLPLVGFCQQPLNINAPTKINIRNFTVATLPTASSVSGTLAYVTDGNSTTDCIAGGGSNKVLCVYNGAAWVISGTGGGGGGGSVFTGSTASAITCGATTTFPLADVSVKSPIRFETSSCTTNVTTVNFTSKTAGASFEVAWLLGTSPFTVTYPGSVTNTCAVGGSNGSTFTQHFTIAVDGTTVVGDWCNTTDGGIYLANGTLPTANLAGNGVLSTGSNQVQINNNNTGFLPATQTVASGTAVLGTGAISSAACASAVTVAGTGIATTDTVLASFNGDPTGVNGYVPLTSGMLTIIGYPSSGNVNFKVCNNTSGSITPGAVTLNWRVVR